MANGHGAHMYLQVQVLALQPVVSLSGNTADSQISCLAEGCLLDIQGRLIKTRND